MKTREEVEAELAKDKEPGGVLAWDRNTKHTPTPWHVAGCSGHPEITTAPCVQLRTADGKLLRETFTDLRLQAASVNSYAKHCKDPVAAAESDLLGRALAFVRTISDYAHGEECPVEDGGDGPNGDAGCDCGVANARALLAETKEGA